MFKIIITNELERNIDVFKNLLSGLQSDVYLWKQAEEKWCLLEIICHLCDEEREDFRYRVKHILENPSLPLNSIDPLGWVTLRKYTEQNYEDKINEFMAERKKSIQWLNSLNSNNWDNVYKHPKLGNLSAKMIFSNWLAHDYLHIRQILKLKYDYLKFISDEDLSYAGNW